MRGLLAAATLLVLVLAPYDSNAEIKEITETCHYVWGDNDSRLDARKMCLLDAKRRVLERAGSLVRSEMKIENGQLTSEEVASFAEAVIQIEVTNEKHGMRNGRNYTELRVKAKFDQAEVKRRLEQKAISDIRGDGPNRPPSARPANGAHFTPGMVFRDCADCPEMVVVPAGSFRMGDLNGDGDSNEYPFHQVMIPKPFAVGKYEVTQAEWRSVMGNNPGRFKGARNPVERVAWEEAKTFVSKLSVKTGKEYRLLSEAEWEYTARAGTTTKYSWGNQASHEYANYGKENCCGGLVSGRDRWEKTAPVGSFQANSFGLHDMLGNVFEWTEDCWNTSYSGAPKGGVAWTIGDCSFRVLRGGSWISDPGRLRAAKRRNSMAMRYEYGGFRVALTLPSLAAPQLASLPPPAQSIEPLDETYVVVKTANVRAKPDVRSKKLATLRIDTDVQVTGRTKDGKWLRIKYNGEDAYIWKPLLMTKLDHDKAKIKSEDAYCSGYISGPEDVAGCESAARNGDAEAQFTLALAYSTGNVIPKNSRTAAKWLKMAANQDISGAQQFLGSVYYHGNGVEKDYRTALKWLKKGIRKEADADTFSTIGLIYVEGGGGVERSYTNAKPWFLKAAKLGNVGAQAMLGIQFYEGRGVYQDYSEAYFWLSLAASQSDKEEFVTYRRKAAAYLTLQKIQDINKHVKIAYAQQRLLNRGYYGGPIDGVVGRTTTQAVQDLQLFKGLPITGSLTGETMSELEQSATQGASSLKGVWASRIKNLRKAEKGDKDSQYSVASYLEYYARRYAKSYETAIKWYRKAADQGHFRALLRLAKLHVSGTGVPTDSVKAYYFLSLAILVSGKSGWYAKDALAKRNELKKRMTPAQISEAERRVAQHGAPQ
jgi:formylglycine-generating enzyme required for sulfatase activity/TPR repeat protein